MLELIENKDFAATATSFSFTGLDGDSDEVYVLAFRIKKAVAAAMSMEIRPNGATTDMASTGHYAGPSAVNVTINDPSMRIADDGDTTAGNLWSGFLILDAKTGMVRTGHSRMAFALVTGPAVYSVSYAVVWGETATNITSLDVVVSQTDGIDVGSYLRLYKLKKAA